jgi:hypothetical protein
MRRAVVLGAISLAVLGGCGSTSLSTAELRTQAGRICTIANRQTDRIPTPSTPAGGAAFLRRGIAVLRPELSALRSLLAGGTASREYATSMSAFAQKLNLLGGTLHDLTAGEDPVVAIKTLQSQLAPIEARENGAWEALEIPACVNR